MRKLLIAALICFIGSPALMAQETNPFKEAPKVDTENPFAPREQREGEREGEKEGEKEGERERDLPREEEREREVEREGDRERDVPREGDREREVEREGDRERDVPREGDREREVEREGEPTISQAQLKELIGYLERLRRENAQLREELAHLRRQISGDRPRPDEPREGTREGDRPRPDAAREGDRPRPDAPREGDGPRPDAPREGDGPRPDAPREGDRPRPDAPREGERGQLAELETLFKRYDRNGDKNVTLEEFLSLNQGNLSEQAKEYWQKFFVTQDRNRNERWSFEEFVGAVRASRQPQR